ncbi:hypothetical protein [Spirosoma terrae]|uniref:Uncharacterized protein n=1 Tax=Spirosoma terrae TaxID=1968276 RepID=A0A6L9LK08_9BACT|nr:hypothetical protein [Spirosoma terrae]NDU99098.1 hypothetical protein [Spirosoma terrae]
MPEQRQLPTFTPLFGWAVLLSTGTCSLSPDREAAPSESLTHASDFQTSAKPAATCLPSAKLFATLSRDEHPVDRYVANSLLSACPTPALLVSTETGLTN